MEDKPELREIEDEFEALAEVHEEEKGEPDTTTCKICKGEVPRTETENNTESARTARRLFIIEVHRPLLLA